jgi:hypothetical protein
MPARGPRKRTGFARAAAILLACALALPVHAFASEAGPDFPTLWAQQAAAEALPPAAASTPRPETAADNKYLIPIYGIVGFSLLLHVADRLMFGDDFDVNASTVQRNLSSGFSEDQSTFTMNQLGHPYQGGIYHGFARSAGLTFWQSIPYTLGGAVMWEYFGETTAPSHNDVVTTTFGGTFLGEALYRMANLVLEDGGGLSRGWRELGAAIVAPSATFNRYYYGTPVFPSNQPAYYGRLQLGGGVTRQSGPDIGEKMERGEGIVDFSLDYGLPGKSGYQYRRPFDYFSFQITGSTSSAVENVATRGMLLGVDYAVGSRHRGILGLYGTYDYNAPQFFRVSSTALSLGTTGQTRVTPAIALQGTALAGAGYTAVGGAGSRDERDNHYGVAPQAIIALKLILADRAALELDARKYFVSHLGAAGPDGHDHIARADAALTWRVHKRHAVSLRYIWTHREATLPAIGDATQIRRMAGIFYTYVGHERLGAVAWQ